MQDLPMISVTIFLHLLLHLFNWLNLVILYFYVIDGIITWKRAISLKKQHKQHVNIFWQFNLYQPSRNWTSLGITVSQISTTFSFILGERAFMALSTWVPLFLPFCGLPAITLKQIIVDNHILKHRSDNQCIYYCYITNKYAYHHSGN